MKKFETGKTYTARSVCDYNCIFQMEVLKRTEKTITVETMQGVKRVKIHNDGEAEFAFPFGRYSMAACFRA